MFGITDYFSLTHVFTDGVFLKPLWQAPEAHTATFNYSNNFYTIIEIAFITNTPSKLFRLLFTNSTIEFYFDRIFVQLMLVPKGAGVFFNSG